MSPDIQQPSASSPITVADEAPQERRRPRGRRGTRAMVVRKINAKARDRHEAWSAGNAAEGLTRQIAELYVDLRVARAGDSGQPFAGRSASYVAPPMPPTRRKWRDQQIADLNDRSRAAIPGSGPTS